MPEADVRQRCDCPHQPCRHVWPDGRGDLEHSLRGSAKPSMRLAMAPCTVSGTPRSAEVPLGSKAPQSPISVPVSISLRQTSSTNRGIPPVWSRIRCFSGARRVEGPRRWSSMASPSAPASLCSDRVRAAALLSQAGSPPLRAVASTSKGCCSAIDKIASSAGALAVGPLQVLEEQDACACSNPVGDERARGRCDRSATGLRAVSPRQPVLCLHSPAA